MPRLSAAMDRLRRSYCHFAAASFAQQRFLIKAIPFAHDVYKRFHFAYSRAHTYTTSNRCTDQPSKRLLANEEGDLPEIGWFSSRGGARRGPSARREKQSQGTQSIRPGQQSPIFRRLPFPPAHTARVDENHPISGRSPP